MFPYSQLRQLISGLLLLWAGIGLFCASGCQSLPNSGLDPYGERLFESCPFQNSLGNTNCDLFGSRSASSSNAPFTPTPIPAAVPNAVPVQEQTSVVNSTTAVPIPASPSTSTLLSNEQIYVASNSTGQLPGNFGAGTPGAPVTGYGSTATALAPDARGINTALIASPDAGPKPLFEETGGYALPTQPVEGPALLMTPREQIAPVGSEVVMIASYLGNKDRLITNEKIEWSLEGVGSIMKFDKGSCCDPLFLDFVTAKKVNDRYAITKTSQVYQHLDRGTPETKDDIHLLRGQSWISINSMREGTSYLSAFAPSLKDWSRRTDFGVIHWVDAQWVLPRLPIAPVGESRLLTTTVLRRTNGQPRQGWIVRYEILNGPPAGFGPSLAQIQEVRTDISGQASIVLSQSEMQSGTNTIGVQIIQPAEVAGSDRRVTVGSETLRQTWTGSAGVRVHMQGPSSATIGKDIPYTITLNNTTSAVASGIVAVTVPPIASLISSNPPPTQHDGMLLQWPVAVPSNGNMTITMLLRQGTPGAMRVKAEFYPNTTSVGPSIHATSVPPTSTFTPSPSRVPEPATQEPASPFPTTPPAQTFGTGATKYDGASHQAPAKVYDAPSVTLSIASPQTPRVGRPVQINFMVQNNGINELRNTLLYLKFPPEYAGEITAIRATENNKRDGRNGISLTVPSIPAGKKALLAMELPTIAQQGYSVTGIFYVDGKEIKQHSVRIKP